AKYTGFETLDTTGGQGTFNLSFLAGETAVSQGALAGAVSYTSAAAGTGLTMTASPGQTTAYALQNATGSEDALSVTLSSAAALTGGTLTANAIENITIVATDTNTVAHVDTLTLAASSLKSLTIQGNAGLTLTNTDTTVTSINAASATGPFTTTTGNFAAAATISGSATAINTVDFSNAATKGVTYVGGAGNDVITGQNGQVNTVTLGNGVNSYTHAGSAGIQTVTGGTGVDTITGGTANDVIVGGGGADQITGNAGADSITVSGTTSKLFNAAVGDSGTNTSTTIQTSQLTSTFDVITGVAAGTTYQLFTNTTALTATNNANLAGVDNQVVFAKGTYDSGAGTFTYATNGTDTAMTYDTTVGGGTNYETVILVGYAQAATTAISGAGLITFA
ncbi:MAG: Ca2+-binding RTX toxin-like protein, partial [Paracoccaceae bacterium]